eukprot:CAMPEP_0115883034 /NCGR_PEP_ID=MMETSP0287-20121206/29341_1 /TAXON_ID=412157 /ORGANISM="Chrysochromulina rotalis, Strain UIO044" /LENGTH=129 /DNA_ID=CAMNT_0003339189 /DNA_START=12 /DNA_END=401 /DNA_ORIENTATION=+
MSEQIDQVWEEVEIQHLSHQLGLPPQPQHQEQIYGSQRPLTAKERRMQIEKMEEIAARRHLREHKEYEKERRAVAKYEMRQKELQHYRKAQQRPKDELKEKQAKARELQGRLSAVRERELAWRERVTAL